MAIILTRRTPETIRLADALPGTIVTVIFPDKPSLTVIVTTEHLKNPNFQLVGTTDLSSGMPRGFSRNCRVIPHPGAAIILDYETESS